MPPPDKKRKRLLEEDLLESKRSRDGGRTRSPIARSTLKMFLIKIYRFFVARSRLMNLIFHSVTILPMLMQGGACKRRRRGAISSTKLGEKKVSQVPQSGESS